MTSIVTPTSSKPSDNNALHDPRNITVQPSTTDLDIKVKFLLSMINSAIQDIGQKRLRNQRKASTIKVTMIALSGMATILLGLQISGFESTLNNIAFILTSTVTLLTAIEPFFNYRALWIEHEQAKANLHRLRDEIEYYISGITLSNKDSHHIDDYHQRYQEIWIHLSNAWIGHRQSNRFTI